MLDFLAMWKKPKMIAYVIITAALYALLVLPFMQFKIFGGHGDFGRLGVGVITAFSFLFGPAAAWGAAIGNTIRDAATSGLDAVTVFGFIANFLLGYIPYKLWNAITKMKPDLRSVKKIGLFVGVCLAASAVCGVVIGWALYWLNPPVPFMPTSLIIAVSDAVWAIVLGSVVLALSYKPLGKRKLLYSDMMGIEGTKRHWTKGRMLALLVFVVCMVLTFALGALLPTVDPFVLLVPALLSMFALVYALR
jgi:energy-coupling factor transport system substrate-specific component